MKPFADGHLLSLQAGINTRDEADIEEDHDKGGNEVEQEEKDDARNRIGCERESTACKDEREDEGRYHEKCDDP